MMTGLCVLRAGNQRFSQHRRSHVWLFTFLIVQNHGCLLGRFTVLANSEQNSRLANFLPESCLPLVQISSIFRKNGRENLELVSKMALKKWNTNSVQCGTFRPDKQDYLFKCSVAHGNFSMKRPKKSFSICFFCKWQTINVSEVACAVDEEKNELKWRLSQL